MAPGGMIDDPIEGLSPMPMGEQNFDFTTDDLEGDYMPTTYAGQDISSLPANTDFETPTPSIRDQIGEFGQDMQSVGQIALSGAKALAPYAPAIMNIGRGLFQDTDVNKIRPNLPSSRGEDTIRRMNTDIDTSEQMSQIDRQVATAMANPNATVADKQAMQAEAMRQRASILQDAQNRESQLENQRLSQLSQAQQQRDRLTSQMRTQARNRYEQQRQRAEAARDRRIDTGMQQLARTYMAQRAERNRTQEQEAALQAMLSGNYDAVNERVLMNMRDAEEEGSEMYNMLDEMIQRQRGQ